MGSFNKEDWEGMEREDLILNLKNALDKIDNFERIKNLLDRTEKGRLKLHQENLSLKEELGVLYFVKEILESAKVYGYADLSKVAIRIEHQEELRKIKKDAKSQNQVQEVKK